MMSKEQYEMHVPSSNGDLPPAPRRPDGGEYPEAFLQYLVYYHGARDFFECHEVLEEYWKQDPSSPLKGIWHGLIQVAVSQYHERRGNTNGAIKMLQSAIERLQETPLDRIGIDHLSWLPKLVQRLSELQEAKPHTYAELDIPLKDQALLEYCVRRCAAAGLDWGAESDLSNKELIHKHKLRDRTDVILARAEAKAMRKK